MNNNFNISLTVKNLDPVPLDTVEPKSREFPAFSPARHAQIGQLKALLRAREGCLPAHHVLYNLLRDLDPRRGFTPPKQRGGDTNRAFLSAAVRARKLAVELGVTWDDTWNNSLIQARRQALLEDFSASCLPGQSPSVPHALWGAMRLTPHGASSDVLSHGNDCWARYGELVRLITSKRTDPSWPQWLVDHGAALLLRQEPLHVMHQYLVNHDCGKAGVLVFDEQGRAHFPEHAKRSAEMWRQAGRSEVEAQLMEMDMALHTLAVPAMAEFSRHSLAPSLLLATFAQLQSNARSVFGGVDSDSYKIKLKALNKRANALLTHWSFPSVEKKTD